MIAALLLLAGAAPAPAMPVQQPPGATRRNADRESWQVDQIRLARDIDPKVIQALGPDHTLEAVATRLTKLGVAFKRFHLTIYPDEIAPQLRDALLGLPKGEPFALPEPDFWSVSVLVGRHLSSDTVLNAPSSSRRA